MKWTKQGVRDLDSLKGPPAGRRLPNVPDQRVCSHPYQMRETSYVTGNTRCTRCGAVVALAYEDEY